MDSPPPAPREFPRPPAGHGPPAGPPPAFPDYELLRRIGGGAYGDVWLARSATGVLRAVKIVWRNTFEDERPFLREFEGIQHFESVSREHPSQLALFHVGRNEVAGYFYYVMELADDAEGEKEKRGAGEKATLSPAPIAPFSSAKYTPHTLRADLAHGRLPAARVLEIGLTLTEALAHLHAHGLVHRDVKPSNVIFVDGRPKLADIGLVTDAGDTRSIVGTEGYLAPEGPGAPQADLFALGKVLYEAVTGLDRRQLPQLPPDLRAWPDARLVFELNEVILKACATSPWDRYGSAEEMKSDLAMLQAGDSVRHRRAWERRLGWGKRVLLASLLIGLGLAGFLLLNNKLLRHPAASKASVTTFETSGTKSREAYNAYCTGRHFWNKRTADGLSNAIVQFEQAIRMDSKFARAYAGLANSYNLLDGYDHISPAEIRPQARAAVLRALELDPALAEVQTSLAKFKFEQEWDWAGAEQAYRRALQLDPDYALAHFWYANLLAALNRLDEAVSENRRAVELDPTSLSFNNILGLNLLYARDYEGAVAQLQKTVALDPYFPSARIDLAIAYLLQGRPEAAVAEWETHDQLLGASTESLSARRAAYQAGGLKAYWQAKKKQLEEKHADGTPPAMQMARLCTFLDEPDEAFAWLNRAYDERRAYLKYINVDPSFDPLRSDPRFDDLLKKMGLERPAGSRP